MLSLYQIILVCQPPKSVFFKRNHNRRDHNRRTRSPRRRRKNPATRRTRTVGRRLQIQHCQTSFRRRGRVQNLPFLSRLLNVVVVSYSLIILYYRQLSTPLTTYFSKFLK